MTITPRQKFLAGVASLWIAAIAASVVVSRLASPEPIADARGLIGVPPGGFIPPTKAGTGGTGDITGVAAGTGLTGGGTSGGVTLNVDPTAVQTRVPTSCGAGEFYSAIAQGGTATCTAEPGDISSVVAGSGLTGGATSGAATVTLNMATATCTNGQAVTTVGATGAHTCGNAYGNDYSGTHFEWNDDFLYSFGGGAVNVGPWVCSATGAGATTLVEATATTTRPGIYTLGTGTTATGREGCNALGLVSVDFASGLWTVEATVGFKTLSTAADEYSFYIGFGDTTTGPNQTDGCGFLYDRGNVATNGNNSGNANQWEIACSLGGVRVVYLLSGQTEAAGDGSYVTTAQSVAALSLPTTNWYRLKIVEVSAGQIDFYVNGVKSGQVASATHIPSGGVTGVVMVITQSANTAVATKTVDIDQVRIAVDLTSARSP